MSLWGAEPVPPHPAYEKFAARHGASVEGYWREQMELAERRKAL